MHLHDILRKQLAIAQKMFGPLTILETGTIRSADPAYELDDGWSTVCFAEWVRGGATGHLISIDLDVSAAKTVLDARGLSGDDVGGRFGLSKVTLLEGPSVHWLGALLKQEQTLVHVAYLDSDNDPTLILDEYHLVTQMMPSGAILMVDDVDLSPGAGARKGHAIVPWLESKRQPYTVVGRHGKGYSTGVLITRIP